MKALLRASSFVASVLATSHVASAFVYVTNSNTGLPVKWQTTPVAMRIQLGTGTTFSDGTNFSTSVQAAMQAWNTTLGGSSGSAQFTSTIIPPGVAPAQNSINEMAFSSDVKGTAFEANTIAVTLGYAVGNERVEADIYFNNARTWDSHRGSVPTVPNALDIRRVALHELGHVLGLNHPDQADPPQSVVAIMNSTVSTQETLATDDVSGVQGLYSPGGVPANDNFANATALDATTSVRATGFNSNSTKEPLEPSHAGNTGGRSVWWKFTAAGANQITITTQGSLYDTLLAVYTGSSVGALTPVASNDDVVTGKVQYSSVAFTATAGTTYYIAVDGFGGDTSAVTLNLMVDGAAIPTTPAPVTTPTSGPVATPTPTPTPTAPASGGGGGGGALQAWFAASLLLLAGLRRRTQR
jgi:hypothetical protein